MTISLGYILGHLCELLLFIYFANTSFHFRKGYVKSLFTTICGYIILFRVGLIGEAPISILSFFIVNVLLLTYCYDVKIGNAVFYSLMLDSLSCIGEYIIIYALGLRYEAGLTQISFTSYQTIFISVAGKSIYLIGIIFLKHFMVKKTIYDSNPPMVLAIIPLLTMVCLVILMTIEMSISSFLLFCVFFLVINIITFYINARLNDKNKELKILQEEYNQNKAELSEYQLLAEKYESTKIIRHDFHKHLSVLKNLIAADNVQAKEYMRQIHFSQRELDYAQYTDNKILNILFAQKIKECHENGIEIHIHSTSPTLSFISDIDTVAIFSNMLDNAIEASENTEEKEIFVDLYTVNHVFSVVKVENYTEREPNILDGMLRTQKKNSDTHGIGIKSINTALKKYNSELTYSYDKENKFFRAMVLIHIPKTQITV